jgi:uncharacterized protein (DUF1501 family)
MSSTRRDFLKTTLGASTLLSLSPAVPAFLSRSAFAGAPQRNAGETVLIVVQMAGGNDGLNTVIPYEDDEYGRNRTTLRFKGSEVHKIENSLLGFHPQMEALSRLYKGGHVGVVQGTGYPNPHGGHFESMRIWQAATPDYVGCQTGWLGRTVDQVTRTDEASVPAAYVGQIAQPFTLNSERSVVPTIRSLGDYTIRDQPGGGDATAQIARSQGDNPFLDYLSRTTLEAQATSRQIEAVAAGGSSLRSSAYPSFPLAGVLQTVVQLMRADLGIRIFYAEFGGAEPGGFDNHANQRGNHGALLHQFSESVAAMVDDLQRDNLLDRVMLMTFSEFGRTVAENGRRGTGHGSAAPMFLVGGKVQSGLIGEHPSLTELENGGPKHHTDFRRVYATMLDRWLGFDSGPVLGPEFKPMDLLKS